MYFLIQSEVSVSAFEHCWNIKKIDLELKDQGHTMTLRTKFIPPPNSSKTMCHPPNLHVHGQLMEPKVVAFNRQSGEKFD